MEKSSISKGIFGLDRKQVEQCILDLEADYKQTIDKRDEKILQLQQEIDRLNKNMEKYIILENDLKQEKETIGNVLLKAQEQANQIVQQTREEFEKEKESLENVVQKERERLIEIKQDVGKLKSSLINVLEKYKDELDVIEVTKIN